MKEKVRKRALQMRGGDSGNLWFIGRKHARFIGDSSDSR